MFNSYVFNTEKFIASKRLLLLLVLCSSFAIAIGFLNSSAFAAQISVCSVCTYTTIQSAIDAANPGDKINVYPAVYNEVLNVYKPLTITGGPGTVLRPDSSTPALVAGGLRVAILVNAVDNVWIQEFEVDGSLNTLNYGIYFFDSSNSVAFNNIVHDIKNDPGDQSGLGIVFYGWQKSINNDVVDKNIIYNCGRMCVFIGGQKDSTTFFLSSNDAVKYNKVYNAWMGPTSQTGHGAIELVGMQNADIRRNIVHDNSHTLPSGETVGYGISLIGSASPSSNIFNNTVYNNVQGITISTNDSRIYYGGTPAATPIVHSNKIYGNALYGLRADLDSAYVTDASLNWWGASSGPNAAGNPGGTGNGIWGNAVFQPYYTDADMTTLSNQQTPSPTFALTVSTQSGGGTPINGLYTLLYKDGVRMTTGFSPVSFTLNSGQQYVVQVQDYGNYTFNHWLDTSSTARARTISISSDSQIAAVYNTEPAAPAPEPTEGLTVKTVDSNGNPISGYYMLLYNNTYINSGFSPHTFTKITPGGTYAIEVQDYGDYGFKHWSDGVTTRARTFVAQSSPMTFTAVYGLVQTQVSQGQSTISVRTITTAGANLTGYYTTLWKDGAQLESGFSPNTFLVNDSTTYQVAVGDYGGYVFDHWDDGSTERFNTVTIGTGTTVNKVATYKPV